jgi:cytochrome aa3-600 menaquinol oxidase subunit 1
MYYWWPKMFGFKLNEALGKWAFWFFNIGFYVCFMPQYALGFMGMTRRVYTYPAESGWGTLNFVSTIGAYLMGIGFLFIVIQVLYSIRHGERDTTGDPWDGRTLEWSLPSPVPHYNFAQIPTVNGRDAWWEMKQQRKEGNVPPTNSLKPIHMPNHSPLPFFMGVAFFVGGFGLVFQQFTIAAVGLIGVVVCMLWRSLEKDTGHWISVDEIEQTEAALRGL